MRRWQEQYEQHGEDAWPAAGALAGAAQSEQRVRELSCDRESYRERGISKNGLRLAKP